MGHRRKIVLLAGAIAVAFSGCRTLTTTEASALGGAALGAGIGGLVGHHNGNTESGALIGAALGTVAGALHGDAVERAEARGQAQAFQQIQHQQEIEAARATRMTIDDVIRLTQNGASDRLIIRRLEQTGSSFDLTTDDVIYLKRNHVSERVIEEMQRPRQPVIVQPAPVVRREVIIHEPPPPPRVHFGIGYHWYGPRRRPHWHCR